MATPAKPNLDYGDIFRFAWRGFQENFLLFIACEAVVVGVWGALELYTFELDERNLGLGLKLATHLLYLLVNAGLWLGFFAITLAIAEGKRPGFTMLFSKLLRGPVFLVGQAAFIAGFLAGMVFLVVPGFYIAGRLVFFPFAMAREGESLVAGFRSSLALTEGAGRDMAKLFALVFALNLVGATLMGIGLVVTIPVSMLALAHVYRAIKSGK